MGTDHCHIREIDCAYRQQLGRLLVLRQLDIVLQVALLRGLDDGQANLLATSTLTQALSEKTHIRRESALTTFELLTATYVNGMDKQC